ncbi:DUF1330 domain-containing protein [Nocardioides panacisoli]|uniref:DUF1330 domain-containing protein n=1 Tax=Nocardioides panacisoli TaxID=627624 RepID=UPI001C63B166|nr:DUF1330 domain-containing protein [Nocardioides panacisoli]QYJ03199.1 DUF1330 domain-containing protein [Nocardioides panacisoli]
MAVDPTAADLQRLLAEDPGGPVVMLNLLRFKPDGRASYDAYAEAAGRFVREYGGTVLHSGDGDTPLVAEDGQAWDAVLVVHYPSRQAFADMVRDPDYRAITHLRTEALAEAVLQPTTPWGG